MWRPPDSALVASTLINPRAYRRLHSPTHALHAMSAVSGVFTATPIDDGDGGGAREAEEEEEDAEWATRTRTRTHATSTRRTLPEQPQPRPAAPDGPNESHTLRADPRDDRGDDSTDSIGPDLLDLDLARPSDPPHRDRDRNALGSSLAALPAFVSRLAAGPGSGAGTGGAKRGRGWKAYESILPGGGSTVAGRHVVVDEYGELEEIEDSDEEEEEEDPVPGAFVVAAGATPPPGAAAHHPQATTLHVYPVPGPGGESEPADGAKYRDAGWIVAYGVSLLAVVALALQAWWTSPPRFPADRAPGTPGGGSNMYRMLLNSAVPNLLALALVSSLAGIASLAYLATIQHLLPALLSLAVIAGPALFVSIGVVAIGGTFSVEGVASDAGWRVGVRVFAVGLFVAAVVLGRSAAVRQKELNRAISVGQVRLRFRVCLRSDSLLTRSARAPTARMPDGAGPPAPAPLCLLPLPPLRPPLRPLPRPDHDPPDLCALVPAHRQLGHRGDAPGLLVDARDREGVVSCDGRRLRRDVVL